MLVSTGTPNRVALEYATDRAPEAVDSTMPRPLMPAESTPFVRFYRAYLELMAGDSEAAVADVPTSNRRYRKHDF